MPTRAPSATTPRCTGWTGDGARLQPPQPDPRGRPRRGRRLPAPPRGHPATARAIAAKLAVRFVSDMPPPALVDRLATAYLEAGTAIVPVLDLLFRSAEFWAAVGQKTRRPAENVAASVRILGTVPEGDPVRSIAGLANVAPRAGHKAIAWPAPNGYPDVNAAAPRPRASSPAGTCIAC